MGRGGCRPATGHTLRHPAQATIKDHRPQATSTTKKPAGNSGFLKPKRVALSVLGDLVQDELNDELRQGNDHQTNNGVDDGVLSG